MNIAVTTIYGEVYEQDQIFDVTSCKIGENLLLPGVLLKNKIENLGHCYHTADVYNFDEINKILFIDLSFNSIILVNSIKDLLKYIYRKKWKKDYLYRAISKLPIENRILLLQEPPTICPDSYNVNYHKYFGKIMTWKDDLVDNSKYFKYFYPQVMPEKKYNVTFCNKKLLTMISGNKRSSIKNELYSQRRKVIDYFENKDASFDLYGFGWEKEKLKNYKGTTESKLDTLSNYKFSVCYENMCNIQGYITEKIFDCFFANCIPIYWGASNIADFIPKNTFIDKTKFENFDEMCVYIENITENEYMDYIRNIQHYLKSPEFFEYFSVDAYVKNISALIL